MWRPTGPVNSQGIFGSSAATQWACAAAAATGRRRLQQQRVQRPVLLAPHAPPCCRQPRPRDAAARASGPTPWSSSSASSQQQQQQQQQEQRAGGAPCAVGNTVSTPRGEVRLGSFLSRSPDAAAAVEEAVTEIRAALGGDAFAPELALVFATAAYGDGLDEVVPALRQLAPSLKHVFGCTSFGAIGSTPDAPADVEGVAGLSVVLASLPGVEIAVTHTLRSGVPDEDASPEAWSDLVGLPLGSDDPTSFLVLADPKFRQTRPLLAGLDFAFPGATKVGGVISSGQRYKRRAMFAWSADGPVQTGSRRKRGGQQQQQQQQQRGEPQRQRQQQQQESEPAADKGAGRGFFGSLLNAFKSGGRSGADDAAAAGSDGRAGAAAGGRGAGGADPPADDLNPSGLHMYGAAVLALRGGVYLDPITSQGYRAVSDRSWVVGKVSRDGSVLYSLVDPSAAPSDDDDGEVPPLLALVDLLTAGGMGQGGDGDLTESELEELSDDRVWVAIAPDALSADKDIAPDDFQMMKLVDFDETFGAICVDGQVRTGYRLKLVLRDPDGIRADLATKLLRLKRDDLAAVLAGEARPSPVGTLLFVDLERGAALHGEAGYEAGQVGAFVPVPLAGMFAAAEVSTVNRKAALYELATVAAVLRVAAPEEDAAADTKDSSEQASGASE